MDQELDDILEHYGIKGMKWGVRRTPEQLARARGERVAKKEAKKAAKTAAKTPSADSVAKAEALNKVKKGGVQTLSNAELQRLNARLNLEQNYSNLTTPKGGKKKGPLSQYQSLSKQEKEAVGFIVKVVGSTLFKTVTKNKTGQQVGNALQPADIIDLRKNK